VVRNLDGRVQRYFQRGEGFYIVLSECSQSWYN
jgi:hypothetical protein